MNKSKKEQESLEEKTSAFSTSQYTGSESDYWVYNCKYCLYGTTTIEALQKHEGSHVVPGHPIRKELKPLHSCEFCNIKFVQKNELEEHKKIHAVGMSCSLCKYTSQNKNTLRNHVRSHNNRISFQCLLCYDRMTSRKMWDDHMNKHMQTLSSCKWCRFTTDTPSRLKAHFQVHVRTKQIQCNSCSYFCFIEEDMKEHVKLHENTNDNKMQSDKVVNTEKVKSTNDKNLQEKLSGIERKEPFNYINFKRLLKRAFFKCSICGEVQKSDEALQRHSYKHIKAQQYSCHICSFKGKNSEEMRNHFMDHLPEVDVSKDGK